MTVKHNFVTILFCIAMFLLNSSVKSQSNPDTIKKHVNISINNGYSEKILLYLVKTKEYKDTMLTFRNYIEGSDEKRIVCNGQLIDKDIEKLIWECKYFELYLLSQKELNNFSFILYDTDNENNTIARYFLCSRESKKAVEMRRFLIENKRIVGINMAPDLIEGHTFTPIEEFEKIRDLEPFFFIDKDGRINIGN